MSELTHQYSVGGDTHYIDLGNSSSPKKVARSVESTVMVDLDESGKIIGFEIFGIKHIIDKEQGGCFSE